MFAKGSLMMAAMRPMTWAAAVSPDFQPPMTRSAPIVEAASASRAAALGGVAGRPLLVLDEHGRIGAHGQPRGARPRGNPESQASAR